MFVHDAVLDYAVRLVLATRQPGSARPRRHRRRSSPTAASPRATLGLVAAGRALALLRGRNYVLPQDVFDVARDVLRHRVLLSYEALADGVTAEDVVDAHRLARSAPRVSRRRRTRPHSSRSTSPPRRDDTVDDRPERDARSGSSSSSSPASSTGCCHGDYQGSCPAPGSEAGDARLYQPGDDVRRIDWSLTARPNATHVRDTIADRELETWLVVDGTASLDFGTAQCEKRDLALAAAAAFGFLTARAGNRVAAVCFDGATHRGATAPERSRRRARRSCTASSNARDADEGNGVARRRAAAARSVSHGGAASSSWCRTCSTGATGRASCAR